MSKQAPLLLEREDLLRLAFLLTHLADDRDNPNAYLQGMFDRGDAKYWLGLVNEILAYDGPGVRHLAMVPMTFKCKGYHTQWVDEFTAEMPESLRASVPGHLAIARHAAELVDNEEYSTDMNSASASSSVSRCNEFMTSWSAERASSLCKTSNSERKREVG